jgi:hypothetical protein
MAEWISLNEQIDALKARELVLRAEIFAAAFPTPEEGVNTLVTPEGVIKGTHKINRTLDAKAWEKIAPSIPSDVQASLVTAKLALNLPAWKALTPSQRLYLADAVNEKPGTPSLEWKAAK